MRTDTQVVMLGTGTPNPVPDRSGPAIALIAGGTPYLVDCGSGCVRQAERARRHGIEALQINKLERAFITHLHSDHTLGLADLLLTPWVLERSEPLRLFGPKGLTAMAEQISKAYTLDIEARLHGLEGATENGYKAEVTEIDAHNIATPIYRDDNIEVEAFAVEHPPFQAYGYKFTTVDKTIVISGDTAPCSALIEAARGCDILIHEVYSSTGLQQRTPKWQRYHSSVHTSSLDLGHIAAQVQPGLLVLYHQLFMVAENETGSEAALQQREQEILREIGQTFSGRVVSARDLDIF